MNLDQAACRTGAVLKAAPNPCGLFLDAAHLLVLVFSSVDTGKIKLKDDDAERAAGRRGLRLGSDDRGA